MIREANIKDIPYLVDIHSLALPEDMLVRLGKRFLTKIFFPKVLASTDAFTLVNIKNGSVKSFAIFAYDSRSLTKDFISCKLSLSISIVTNVFKNFGLIYQIVSYLRGFRIELTKPIKLPLNAIPELYLIATHPQEQNKGLGGEILTEGLHRLYSKNKHLIVKTYSESAKIFYIKFGFTKIGYEYRGKRKLLILFL